MTPRGVIFISHSFIVLSLETRYHKGIMPTIVAGFLGGLLIFGAIAFDFGSSSSTLAALGLSFDSSVVSAQTAAPPLVPCGNQGQDPCQACHLVSLAKNILNFGVYMTVFIAAIMFSWAGFYYFTSAGNEENIQKAHTIFKNVFIGMLFVLLAWVIVDTIMKTLFSESSLGQRYGPWYQIRCVPTPTKSQSQTTGGITASPASNVKKCSGSGTDPSCIYEESLNVPSSSVKSQTEVRSELEEAIQREQEEERARLERERSE